MNVHDFRRLALSLEGAEGTSQRRGQYAAEVTDHGLWGARPNLWTLIRHARVHVKRASRYTPTPSRPEP